MLKNRKYTYRIVFIPETIGSIAYLSKHYKELKKNVIAGFNITCVGDNRIYSYLPSRIGNSLSDRIVQHVLHHIYPNYKRYTYLERGSDERQYCSPGIDLPIASLMRSKYRTFPEYHTSHDNLDFVSIEGLYGGYNALWKCLKSLEINNTYQANVFCEPQLSKRGLYSTLSKKTDYYKDNVMLDVLTYGDTKHDLLDIAEILNVPLWKLEKIVTILVKNNLIKPTTTNLFFRR